jgi:signal transduction histidine kinase
MSAWSGARGRRDRPDANGRREPEAPILRRTRWRLIAWSAGSTLVVLVVLGIAIYVATATSLAASAVKQLQGRITEMSNVTFSPGQVVTTQFGVTSDPSQPGLVIGGDASGTIGFMVVAHAGLSPDGKDGSAGGSPGGGPVGPINTATVPLGSGATGALPVGPQLGVSGAVLDASQLDPAAQASLAAGETIIRETTIGTAQVRLIAAPLVVDGRPATAIVIGDRNAEVDTLRTLLIVLLGGGVAVLAASVVVGYVYAGRALVPIRESLRRQREFAADASHELRTPLTITRAAIAELRRGRGDQATVDRALDDLDAGATRLELLVDDLLLLARTDADAVSITDGETDLALAAAEAAEAFESVAAAAGVRLVLDVEPAPVRGDEARLRQLAGILLDNAIRHSPAGGRVTLTVRPGARLTVDDEGPGLDPANLEHVFERFWRAPGAPAGGTGLGLAIARWIAERHRGTVSAENRVPGPGARFVVTVPEG